MTCGRRLVPLSHPLVNVAVINSRSRSVKHSSDQFSDLFLTLLNVFYNLKIQIKHSVVIIKCTFSTLPTLNVPSVLQETLQQLIVMPLPNILHIAKDPISGNTHSYAPDSVSFQVFFYFRISSSVSKIVMLFT